VADKETKVREALKTLFEYIGLPGDEEIEDVEVITTRKASDTLHGNNPCSHEGQADCRMRCKHNVIKPGQFYHCHVNNCDGSGKCNTVVDLNC
jgi:hypothetical protein